MSRPHPLPVVLEDLLESGVAAQRSGNVPLAAERYTSALAIAPNNFDALQLLGLLRVQNGQLAEGVQLMRRAVAIAPRATQVLHNLGTALRDAGAYRESVEYLRRALEIEPNSPALLTNMALTLISVGELATASRCLERAVQADPENPTVLYAFGQLLQFHAQPALAVQAYRRAIARGLTGHDVHHDLGLVLQDVADAQGAWEAFNEAERVRPSVTSRLYRAYAGLLCARWESFRQDSAAFLVADPQLSLEPFRLLHFPLSAAGLRAQITRVADGILAKSDALEPPGAPLRPAPRRERVRIAYLSPDFRSHPVGVLLAGMLPEHDRTAFEVFAYAWGPKDTSGIRERIANACDHFEEVGDIPQQALIARLRAAEIDIAIDLCGHTGHNRMAILAARIAPVQVNWLGYPGTTGILDYICADARIIPPESEQHFTEQVIRLPGTYLPYDRGRDVARPHPRSHYGLAEDAVVLACFGQLRKLNPLVFDAWMQVLREVPRAVLWLSSFTYPAAESALREAAKERGVDPSRIIFARYETDAADHLARYKVADLMLDTYPYGSHSTAADALWAGCLLVSLAGDSFVSRVSGSILAAAGFPELVVTSMDEYTALIRDLAVDAPRRNALRDRLAAQRHQCALFDTRRFVKALESAFRAMHERRLQGKPPAAFDVAEDGRVYLTGDPELGSTSGPAEILSALMPAPSANMPIPAILAPTSTAPVPASLAPASAASSVNTGPALSAQEAELRALVSRAFALQRAGNSAEAAACCESALALDPVRFDALQLLGVVRFRLGDLQRGIDLLQTARQLNPTHAPTLNNLGNALQAANRVEEAIECYRRAIEAPDAVITSHLNLGLALYQRGDLEAAYAAFSGACELDPYVLSARATRAAIGCLLAEWRHYAADVQSLLGERPANDPATIDPGPLQSLDLPPSVQRRYADAYARHLRTGVRDVPATTVTARHRNRPLRIAYLSADLREHAVGHLLAPLLEVHDRTRMTSYAYSWYQWPTDTTRTRIQRGVDNYRDVTGRTNAELRALLAQDEIDIAVDLMGHTSYARPALYTYRVAPTQVGWLGYAGSMGEGLLDWLIADRFIIPDGAESYYSERILRLPDTYLPYDPARRVAAPRTRSHYGLPESGIVLASLGQVRKITPQVFAVWMDALREIPDAVLWLGQMAPQPTANLRATASAAGVDPRRLVFATFTPDNADHLARYHVADLVLDTFPYGAHSTVADALWVGCPVVALTGENFPSRVSGSVLSAAGMAELITYGLSEYRARVLELARDAAQRETLRTRIAERRGHCALFDIRRFARSLEDAFERMHGDARVKASTP